MKLRSAILMLTLLAPAAMPARAAVYRMLTGDYTTINADGSAYENGWSYDTVVSGSPSAPQISSEHFAGSNSIQIQVPTDTSGNKERFEYVICHATDTNGVHFDNARYCGFAFKLASPAAAFTGSDLFWQGWQGSPWGPPASLKLTTSSGAPFTIGLYIRNMATGPDSANPDLKLWSSAMIQPDTWYSVVIYISPRYTNNNGNIKLWINGANYVDCTTNIGYDPSQVAGALNGLDIKDGIYQPDANNGHTMYFDQVIFADTYAEGAATPLPANTPPIASSGAVTILRNTSATVDLSALTHDAESTAAQCLFAVSATNGVATLLPDGHTASLAPATNFVGAATYNYTVTDNAEDPRELLHYRFEPPDTGTNGFVFDSSGHLRDGNLLALGTGAFSYSTNVPPGIGSFGSLQLTGSGTANAARLARYFSDPAEFNFSDSSWTFAGWFQRASTADNDFIFYLGDGDGFGGDGDELQLYCPNAATTLALQHYNTNNVQDVNGVSPATAAAGQWHHAALVFQRTNGSAGILTAYLDGAPFLTTNVAWSLPQQLPVVFGGHNKTNSNLNRWFAGYLDDLVIFTNALSNSEVAGLATHTVGHFAGLSATNYVTVTVTNYSRPRLGSLALTNGTWNLSVSGDAGATYLLQSSTNLLAWASLLTTNPSLLPWRYTEPAVTGPGPRFYRILITP